MILLNVVDNIEQTAPSNALKARIVGVLAPPNEDGLTDNMIFGNEAPIARIGTVVAVIAHHPIVIHLEFIGVSESSIDVDLSILYR